VAFNTEDQVLVIWDAINLLGEVNMFPDTDEMSKIFAETEIALVNIISKIIKMRKLQERPSLRLVSPLADKPKYVSSLTGALDIPDRPSR
jgi:hypothetical protein